MVTANIPAARPTIPGSTRPPSCRPRGAPCPTPARREQHGAPAVADDGAQRHDRRRPTGPPTDTTTRKGQRVRSLVVCSIVSLDGFSAGPGGDVLALPFDDGFNAYALERLRSADTLLNGRTTFEEFHGYWPGLADDADAPARSPGTTTRPGTWSSPTRCGSRRTAPGPGRRPSCPAPTRRTDTSSTLALAIEYKLATSPQPPIASRMSAN